jgi:hypothetical protein
MANASVMPNDVGSSGEVIFILNGPEHPTDVQLGVTKHSGQKFMRLPDLGAMSQNLGPKKLYKGADSSRIHRELSKNASTETAQATNVQKKSLKFKPTKVSGRPKLPSIQFSSLSPTLELYEEAPSLDFTDKSLKDGGF